MNKYYAVLGLPTTASKDEVRRKYRQLVLIWHPDRNSSPEAHSKFIALTEAYDVLMGERKVPRTSFQRSTRKASPPPRKKSTQELFREKYLQERETLRKSGKMEERLQQSNSRILRWKIILGIPCVLLFTVWFIEPLNVLTKIFICLGAIQCVITFGMHVYSLSRQAQMTFGADDNYDYNELRDYYFRKHELRWGKGTVGGGKRFSSGRY